MEGRNYIGIDNGVCDKEKSRFFNMPWADVARIRLEELQ